MNSAHCACAPNHPLGRSLVLSSLSFSEGQTEHQVHKMHALKPYLLQQLLWHPPAQWYVPAASVPGETFAVPRFLSFVALPETVESEGEKKWEISQLQKRSKGLSTSLLVRQGPLGPGLKLSGYLLLLSITVFHLLSITVFVFCFSRCKSPQPTLITYYSVSFLFILLISRGINPTSRASNRHIQNQW